MRGVNAELTKEVRRLRQLIETALVGGIFIGLVIWAPRLLSWGLIVLAVILGVVGIFAAITGVRYVLDRIEQATEFRTTVRGREVRVTIWGWLVLAFVLGSVALSMR
jgi:hypothetical protein